MKQLITFFTLISLLVGGHAYAAENTACKDDITVNVNGMVCDFCARALEKVFTKQEDVAAIHVDLDNSRVVISMEPGKTLDDALIQQLITDSGYDIQSIETGC